MKRNKILYIDMDGVLVDDREKNGAGEFDGKLVQFGQGKFPDWMSVKQYLLGKQ